MHGAAAVDAASDFSDAAHSQPSGQTIDDILREFGDFFTSQHPTPRRPPVDAPLPGDDVHIQASLTLQEAAFGTTKNLSIRSAEACSSCNATGKTSDTRIRKCPQCGGEGRVRRPGNEAGMMFHTVIMPCHRCEGAGKLMENACASCDGQGRLSAVREVAVAFPKGCDTGMVVRLPKGAGVGVRGGERGDLYVQVVMKEDDYFHRDGRHVHIVAPISVAQAALGGLVEVRTLDGKEQVKIRPGSQSDDSVTLYGRGLTSVRGGGIAGKRGNQIVHLKVVVPETVSGKQKELLEELLELEGGRMEKPEDCQMPALMRRFQRWLRRSVS